MLNVFICEDNNVERKRIKKIVEDVIIIEELDMKVVLASSKPQEIINYLNNNKGTGLYFLDVDLKSKTNGIKLAEKIREYDPRGFIVFITTHAEMSYLTFIYKVEAMDYIIKDNFKNIRDSIHKCILNANKKYLSKTTELQKNFTLKVQDKVISMEYDKILFFETSPTIHKIILHGTDRIIEFYSKMKDIQDKLDSRFCRCHRSYLINKDNIKEINRSERVVYMINGESCLVSTRLIKNLIGEKLA